MLPQCRISLESRGCIASDPRIQLAWFPLPPQFPKINCPVDIMTDQDPTTNFIFKKRKGSTTNFIFKKLLSLCALIFKMKKDLKVLKWLSGNTWKKWTTHLHQLKIGVLWSMRLSHCQNHGSEGHKVASLGQWPPFALTDFCWNWSPLTGRHSGKTYVHNSPHWSLSTF